eukprot:PITA_11970
MALVGECVQTEPSSFEEAVQQPVWVDAMVEEYDSIIWNCVWDVVPTPEDKSLGIDHDENFALVARYSSIRSMLALLAQMGWKIHQMDVKTAFLNGKIEEEVYIEQPKGFETFNRDDQLIKSSNEDLARDFEMKDMGLMHYFLGMEVCQKDGEVFVSQGKYANEILRRFHVEKCKPMQTPLVGNWRKEGATSVSWYNRKQRSITLSSIEVEYMAASHAECEAIWMRKILVGLFGQRMDPNVIYCDNQSCIKLSENLVFHDRSKHIDIWYHHLQECVVKRIMLLLYVSTEEQDAYILTKALSKLKFEFHRDRLG